MRFILYTVWALALTSVPLLGFGWYAQANALGRCHQVPEGLTLSSYQRSLAVKNPGKVAMFQKTQASRFLWESDTGTVHCPDGQYSVVIVDHAPMVSMTIPPKQ